MSQLSQLTVGFVGSGNMAEAMLRGLIDRAGVPAGRISISDVRAERVAELADALGVRGAASNADVLAHSDVVVLAVKPQGFAALAEELAGRLRPEHLLVSILAGTRAEKIEAAFAHPGCSRPRVVRTMPNTPALLGEGATAIAAGAHATKDDLELAVEMFSAVGAAEVVEAKLMDAITGLTGSGPAYVFRMIEGLLAAAADQGVPAPVADRLVKQMVYGAALMARESEHDPAELRRRVTSPGGTTAAGLAVMDARGFVETIAQAVDAATRRSAELGK